MPISGKIIVYTTPDGKSCVIGAHNESENAPMGVTHNYVPDDKTQFGQHDDNGRYGHGMEVQPGQWSRMVLPIGGAYHHYTIKPGGVLQLGLRAACYQRVPIPEPGAAPVILDLEKDFIWYGNEVEHKRTIGNMERYRAGDMKLNAGANGDGFIEQMVQAIEFQKLGLKIEGEATVTACPRPDGTLSHWTVLFENQGATPFMGTVVFEGADKNGGIGLEAMGVPSKGSRAEQDIQANGNYGHKDGGRARPGMKIRLGVRGLSNHTLELPAQGSVVVPLTKFKFESMQDNKKFFELEEVENKRREKIKKVRFYENGKPINDIDPIFYRGQAALALAPCDPPALRVERVPDSDENPGGGWIVQMESTLPSSDKEGSALGFVTSMMLGGPKGWAPDRLPKKKFLEDGQLNTWFIPECDQHGPYLAKAGEKLFVSTGGLGWSVELELPETEDHPFDTREPASSESWTWHPHNESRYEQTHEFVSKCTRGPDAPQTAKNVGGAPVKGPVANSTGGIDLTFLPEVSGDAEQAIAQMREAGVDPDHLMITRTSLTYAGRCPRGALRLINEGVAFEPSGGQTPFIRVVIGQERGVCGDPPSGAQPFVMNLGTDEGRFELLFRARRPGAESFGLRFELNLLPALHTVSITELLQNEEATWFPIEPDKIQ